MSREEEKSAPDRRRMLDEQLRRRNITSPRVLEAMARIPRERFVPLLGEQGLE
jgi:protein-L-isoaspartate O-methyltransferase